MITLDYTVITPKNKSGVITFKPLPALNYKKVITLITLKIQRPTIIIIIYPL